MKGLIRLLQLTGMVRNILFDIDDTLFPSTEFSSIARKNAINAMIAMGFPSEYSSLSRKLEEIIAKRGSNYGSHFDELCKGMGISDSGRFVAAAVAAYHDSKTSIAPFPKVPLTLLRLKEEGYLLHIATNGSSIKQWDKLIRLRIALYFDSVFVSEEVGREKDIIFFRKILKDLQAKPGDCLMVGDREESDIVPAKKAGLRTVRVKSGKYSSGQTVADYAINEISELLRILKSL